MAEPRLGRGVLMRLAKEIADEVTVAADIADQVRADAERLRGLSDDAAHEDAGRGLTAVIALGLHRWYSAIEAMMERVERVFGTLPTGAEWHSDLLLGASSEIPEVRPAILSEVPMSHMRELLKFRHFLRHAYAVTLDPARLLVLVTDLEAVERPVRSSLSGFATALRAMARALPA